MPKFRCVQGNLKMENGNWGLPLLDNYKDKQTNGGISSCAFVVRNLKIEK